MENVQELMCFSLKIRNICINNPMQSLVIFKIPLRNNSCTTTRVNVVTQLNRDLDEHARIL